ncbi:hypothetical protein GCM10027294_00160 [Marinactinospora endophytica]
MNDYRHPMGNVADDPATRAGVPPSDGHGRGTRRGASARGLSVAGALGLSNLSGARVLAGAAGPDRVIQLLDVMEVPDTLPRVKPHEPPLSTGYPPRDPLQGMPRLVRDLAERDLAASAIKPGRYVEGLPPAMLRAAAEPRLPVPRLGDDAAFDDVIDQLLTDILNRQAAGQPAPRRATASPSGWPRPGEDRSRPPRPPAGSPPTDGGGAGPSAARPSPARPRTGRGEGRGRGGHLTSAAVSGATGGGAGPAQRVEPEGHP